MEFYFSEDSQNKNPEYNKNSIYYNGELIEVTNDNLFRRRYKVWNNKDDDIKSYIDEANELIDTENFTPKDFYVAMVFLKDSIVRSKKNRGTNFHPLEIRINMNDDYKNHAKKQEKELINFFISATKGRIKLKFKYFDVTKLLWESNNSEWTGNLSNFPAVSIIEDYILKNHAWLANKIDLWVLNIDKNGIQKINEQASGEDFFKPGPNETFLTKVLNGRVIKMPSKLSDKIFIHEMGHVVNGYINEQYGYKVYPFHGGNRMGYTGYDAPEEWIGSTDGRLYYFNMFRYYVTPDIWLNFNKTIQISNPTFQNEEFYYNDIKDDFQNKLPLLTLEDIITLTTLNMNVKIENNITLFKVVNNQRDRLISTHHKDVKTDLTPSNSLDRRYNNIAVLNVYNGNHWIFVKPEFIDIFGQLPQLVNYDIDYDYDYLPIYGVFRYSDRSLIVMKVPFLEQTPLNELDYFLR